MPSVRVVSHIGAGQVPRVVPSDSNETGNVAEIHNLLQRSLAAVRGVASSPTRIPGSWFASAEVNLAAHQAPRKDLFPTHLPIGLVTFDGAYFFLVHYS